MPILTKCKAFDLSVDFLIIQHSARTNEVVIAADNLL